MTWLIPIVWLLFGATCATLAARCVSRREREVAENTAEAMITLARAAERASDGGYRDTPHYDAYVAGMRTVTWAMEQFQRDGLRVGMPQFVAVLRNGVRQRTSETESEA